jgi:hypothetical protein
MAKKKVEKELVENEVTQSTQDVALNELVAENELVENEDAQPTQSVTLNEAPVQAETPGHNTRAFRC